MADFPISERQADYEQRALKCLELAQDETDVDRERFFLLRAQVFATLYQGKCTEKLWRTLPELKDWDQLFASAAG